jgi:hypothetical protein
VAAQEFFGVLCRNQVAELLGLYYQVCKIIKLAQNIFGQLHTMFLQELVQEILLVCVVSIGTFHVEQFSIMNCEYKKKGLLPFHFLKISVDKFLINVDFV